MTDEARKIFSELLEVNFELTVAQEVVRKHEANYRILTDRLRNEMGAVEYETFISRGKAMFAPRS